MDNFIVSARKYRPSTFDSVVGQKALTATLKNAVVSGRLGHAYLFCGPRGVGKTTCARIFAKSINCLTPTAEGNPCNVCESCAAFNEQRSMNIHELDAASNNSIEDIRAIIEQVRIPPQVGKYKIFIVDEVHMLSTAAFNAFLKTLEEPPEHVIFVLATTEKHKLLPTIISRCQIFDFARIGIQDIIDHLAYVVQAEGMQAEPEALGVIARKADGGMRDALSMLDQMISFTAGDLSYAKVIENLNVLDYDYYFRMTDALLRQDVSEALLLFDEILSKGFEGSLFIGGLAAHFRNLLVAHDVCTVSLLEVAGEIATRYTTQAQSCAPTYLYQAIKLCNDCDMHYRTSRNKRLLVELALIQVAQLIQGEAAQMPPTATSAPIQRVGPEDQGAETSSPTPPATQQAIATPETGAQLTSDSTVTYTQTQTISSQAVVAADKIPQTELKTPTTALKKRTVVPLLKRNTTLPVSAPDVTTQKVEKEDSLALLQSKGEVGSFTLTDVQNAWYQFTTTLPQADIAMAGRMRSAEVNKLDETTLEVVAENHIVSQYFEQMKPNILAYLRTHLHHSHLELHIRVPEITDKTRAITPQEVFKELMTEDHAFRRIVEGMQLGLV